LRKNAHLLFEAPLRNIRDKFDIFFLIVTISIFSSRSWRP